MLPVCAGFYRRVCVLTICDAQYIVLQNWLEKWMYGQGRCVQGNHSKHTHTGNLAYAFDFKLKQGTKVRSFNLRSTHARYEVPGIYY